MNNDEQLNNNFNLLTGRENNMLVKYGDAFIHQDALAAFQNLQKDARDEIHADLQIVSSFRDFTKQLSIWNLKASGQRPLVDEAGKLIDSQSLSSQALLSSILKWSAIPGGSRHHWGTDIDIFDASKIKKEDLKLLQSECLPHGPCGELHLWLDEKIRKNKSYGFFRPYDTERGGVGVEKWHLSFAPVSQRLFNIYTFDLFKKNIEVSDILLKKEILEDTKTIYNQYIKNIDSCPFELS